MTGLAWLGTVKQNNSLPQLPPGLPVCSCAPPSDVSHMCSHSDKENISLLSVKNISLLSATFDRFLKKMFR